MTETRYSSLANPSGHRSYLCDGLQGRRWVLALSLSLLAHILFWGLRDLIPAAEVPKPALPETMTITLTSALAKPQASESKAQSQQKPPPPEPPKPKVIPKPKPVTPKPLAKVIEEPTPPKVSDVKVHEETQEQKAPSPAIAAPSAPASQVPPTSAEPTSGHFEGPKLNADYLHNPRPDYPVQAKRMGWEGRVLLRVEVLASGSVGQVSIAKSSGHDLLDEAALDAVRRWKFVPAKRDGMAVNSSVNVPINFNLKNE